MFAVRASPGDFRFPHPLRLGNCSHFDETGPRNSASSFPIFLFVNLLS
jgi:hypothetical protein